MDFPLTRLPFRFGLLESTRMRFLFGISSVDSLQAATFRDGDPCRSIERYRFGSAGPDTSLTVSPASFSSPE